MKKIMILLMAAVLCFVVLSACDVHENIHITGSSEGEKSAALSRTQENSREEQEIVITVSENVAINDEVLMLLQEYFTLLVKQSEAPKDAAWIGEEIQYLWDDLKGEYGEIDLHNLWYEDENVLILTAKMNDHSNSGGKVTHILFLNKNNIGWCVSHDIPIYPDQTQPYRRLETLVRDVLVKVREQNPFEEEEKEIAFENAKEFVFGTCGLSDEECELLSENLEVIYDRSWEEEVYPELVSKGLSDSESGSTLNEQFLVWIQPKETEDEKLNELYVKVFGRLSDGRTLIVSKDGKYASYVMNSIYSYYYPYAVHRFKRGTYDYIDKNNDPMMLTLSSYGNRAYVTDMSHMDENAESGTYWITTDTIIVNLDNGADLTFSAFEDNGRMILTFVN